MAKLKESQISLIMESLKIHKTILESKGEFGENVIRHMIAHDDDIQDKMAAEDMLNGYLEKSESTVEEIILLQAQLIQIKRQKQQEERQEVVSDVQSWIHELGDTEEDAA